jgi:hypothetical protein
MVDREILRSSAIHRRLSADNRVVIAQPPSLPPALQRIVSAPILASEHPAGFPRVKITRLDANGRIHTLGGVRIDFSNGHSAVSASYALMRTHAAAVGLARRESTTRTGGLFFVRAAAAGRFALGVTGATGAMAKSLLVLATAHLQRSQR